jgi:DNA-binding response OmpR family regulator
MSAALLIAEPETETRGFLARTLASDGFEIVSEGPELVLLEVGATVDYAELLARVRSVLGQAAPKRPEIVEAGPVAIDTAARRVTVSGRAVALAQKEYELLLKLATQPLRVFTKEELLREVWGFVSLGCTRTLDTHASRLRRKLRLVDAATPYVVNVWGVGYRLLKE